MTGLDLAACNRFGDGLFRYFDCKRYYSETYPMAANVGRGFRLRIFQALMPFISAGCFANFSHLIESVDHWIAFAIFAFLGGRMIFRIFQEEECCKLFNPTKPESVFTGWL